MVKDHIDDLAAFQKEEAATQNQKLKERLLKRFRLLMSI